MSDTKQAKTVAALFTNDEWAQFVAAGEAYAEQQGGIFVLDEAWRMFGERTWARYIRQVMEAVGLPELAVRINPEDFEPHLDTVDGLMRS